MMVWISGGCNARVEVLMLVFRNSNSSCPIRGVADNVSGVSYRSASNGSMDRRVFENWRKEPKAMRRLLNGKKRIIFVNKCSGHNGFKG